MDTHRFRRRTRCVDDLIITEDEDIAIIDNGCDQSIISSNSFLIQTHTGVFFSVDGALHGMHSPQLEVVNDAFTLAILPDRRKIILHVNQALLDTNGCQSETLFQPHQMRAFGVIVDDCPSRHLSVTGQPGTQRLTVDGVSLPMYFDGWKCYMRLRKPSHEDLSNFPIFQLTSPRPYEPQGRITTRRVHRDRVSDDTWRARLGFPTREVTTNTLRHTSQMIQTLQSETSEFMRDYYKTRVWALRPKRINDTCYTDTFHSSLHSIRGYKYIQMFAFKSSGLDEARIMKRESEAANMYEDVIRHIGAPNRMVSDNARTLNKSAKFTSINRRFCIETGFTVPHHQSSNLAENSGGNLKVAVRKLFLHTPHAPLEYWCYAVEFLNQVRRYLSKSKLDNRTPWEMVFGETPDLSVFRFQWFQPVWYFHKQAQFPTSVMQPGFFLNVAENTGDGFSYVILPVKDYSDIPTDSSIQTIVRGVVRTRDISSTSPPPRVVEEGCNIRFYDWQNNELFGDDELRLADEYDDEYDASMDADSSVHDSLVDLPLDTISEESDHSDESVSEEPTLLDLDIGVNPLVRDVDPVPVDETLASQVVLDESSLHAHPSVIPSSPSPDASGPDIPIISQTQDSVEVEDVDSDDEDDGDPVIPPFDANHSADDLADDVNRVFESRDSDVELTRILDHSCTNGVFELFCSYSSGDTEWHPFDLVQSEDPQLLAEYCLTTDLGPVYNGKYGRWARAFSRALKRTMRRLRKSNCFGFESSTYNSAPTGRDLSQPIRRTRRERIALRRAEKQDLPNTKSKREFKYGIEVPRSWKDLIRLDTTANNRKWQDAVEKEVSALIQHQCFDFKPPGFKPPSDFQYCRLHFVYDVKNDLRYKARLVCNGSQVDPRGLSTRATVVKTVSVRLLDVIAAAQNLEVLTGDIGNAFIQAHTKEKIYTRCGSEFGPHAGSIAVIVRALYGLTTSAERFRTLFADYLRDMGFVPTRYDRDVWMRLREDGTGYCYVCTHVDDFKVVSKNPGKWIEDIAKVFLIKEHGPRAYYLGNNYKYHTPGDVWTFGTTTYATEAVARVERIYGCLKKVSTPLPVEDCHPELDDSELLGIDDHRKFQMLLGMLQWLQSIGRPDLSTLVSSLNRFGACPREGHLQLAIRAFGFVKYTMNEQIAIDPRPLQFSRSTPNFESLIPDFLQDYPEASEELDSSMPKSFGPILSTTILVDADHAHDKKTRRSLTGLLAFVGSTPVTWYSKRQGSIASSTYAAEFSALRTATEEAVSLRYMLRCLGCQLPADGSCPTDIFGDNLSVILNAQNPAADLSKKHVAISFHAVREAVAAQSIRPHWLKGKWNLSDIMTKQIPRSEFQRHVKHIFYHPDFTLHNNNGLDEDYDGD